MSEIRIRSAKAEDAPEVAKICNHYILRTTATFAEDPLTPEEIRKTLRSVRGNRCPFLVAETNAAAVAGYACANRFRALSANRLAELSVYLAPECTGHGWGIMLVRQLLADLQKEGFYAGVVAVVTAENKPSLKFHRNLGFQEAGLWKRAAFKFNHWCDAQVLEYLFPPNPF